MSELKAVIFDVDGTLAETERDGHRIAFNRAFNAAGLDWYWDEALYGQLLAVTGGKERIRYFLSDFHTECVARHNIDQLITQLHVDKTRHYVSLLDAKSIRLRPGVTRLISEIRQAGLRLAIATTTTHANVVALIKSTLGEQAIEWFDCIAAGDVVTLKKPAPDIYHHCLKQIDLLPLECLAIEDSENGVLSATTANIPTLVTFNSYTQNDDFSRAIAIFNHLGEQGMPCQSFSDKAIAGDYIKVSDLKQLHAYG